ncbi:Cell division protein FtsI (Peptidoglycan synthetase) [Rhodovastum atsumiense]|uniref:peptidoglycan D,D-transpeptidase FtsI family protein n=1 Tax=Rhodovastum atsumiense TaxID=504468 RepID=UPI0020242F6F|nr:penicillin-binding protein 2 [Rhodovastum atsumiense]CAH2599479.1 Cell division protein FtsI (Peptidoglycan synthetase) [Rhodovastum atsumiense]
MTEGPLAAPSPSSPARRFGAPREAAVPRMETVRITAPDLQRRAALERTRERLVLAAGGFALLFAALVVKLADASIFDPRMPRLVEQRVKPPEPPADGSASDLMLRAQRAMITDRNGEILAISLPTAAVYANPREMIDPAETARKLKSVLPRLDEDVVLERLSGDKQFVYLARQITPREQLQINALGIPGVYFESTERRRYPMGRVAAQVLGGVDVDGNGVAGVERFFEQRLRDDPAPLRLSIDVRVQAVVRDELSRAMEEFSAIGACGIVMDVRTGEIVAMASLPDYDANTFGQSPADDRFNRCVTGVYEPGSTFKLQTASMALDNNVVNLWNGFDASHAIRIGRFTINDFEGKHRFLYVPEILAYSSNIGAARMAEAAGPTLQRAWMEKMGMLRRLGVELPEAAAPMAPPAANWKEVSTLTIAFGHGIAVSPLHVVAGTAAIANGGVYMRPTVVAAESGTTREGRRVMQQSTSDTMRRLMRLVVTDGFGKNAEVPGYYVGGKTGTAEKIAGRGYNRHSRVAAFMGAFPMNAPRYAVYMMLDEPHATKATYGYATAGWVSAPAAGRVIARAAPMLGLLPQIESAATISAQLAIPLQPPRPGGAKPAGAPVATTPAPRPAPPVATAPRPAPGSVPAAAPPVMPAPRDLRHEARATVPAPGPSALAVR